MRQYFPRHEVEKIVKPKRSSNGRNCIHDLRVNFVDYLGPFNDNAAEQYNFFVCFKDQIIEFILRVA